MVCFILFCIAGNVPIKDCPYFLGKATEKEWDKVAETYVKKGAPIVVCGEENYVKSSVYYKVRFQ